MLSKVKGAGIFGIEGYTIDVEVDISNGLPAFDIVGLPDTAVKESKERVRAAIRNSGLDFPMKRITVNLAPADTKKEGPSYDLAIAMGILIATGQVNMRSDLNPIFLGELSLDGGIRPINGVLPMLLSICNSETQFVIPKDNISEAANVDNIDIYAAGSLSQLVADINKPNQLKSYKSKAHMISVDNRTYGDFSDIKGQEGAKRALEIGAAGGHNILMVGPPGSGKTMLAKRIPSIMPDLTYGEAIEITQIYSAAGLLEQNEGLKKVRPFRSPHHNISASALVGGGKTPKPGEVSLAHHGVLFLDELPEFGRDVLELLRQPLEDENITIARVSGTVTFPAKFMLVSSMNPCPCGFYGHPSKQCRCTPSQITRYLSRISGPLLDRFDIHIEVPPVTYDKLSGQSHAESSNTIRKRVNSARQVQVERYKNEGIFYNAQLCHRQILKYCQLDEHSSQMLKNAFDALNLSARAFDRILKVARTIADLDQCLKIKDHHLAEAIQYRSLDRQYWL